MARAAISENKIRSQMRSPPPPSIKSGRAHHHASPSGRFPYPYLVSTSIVCKPAPKSSRTPPSSLVNRSKLHKNDEALLSRVCNVDCFSFLPTISFTPDAFLVHIFLSQDDAILMPRPPPQRNFLMVPAPVLMSSWPQFPPLSAASELALTAALRLSRLS